MKSRVKSKLKLILIFTSLVSISGGIANAQLILNMESGIVEPNVESGSNNSLNTVQYPYDFRAKDYFATRYEGSYVDPEWPDRVTLEPVEISLEEFKRKIVGQWQVMFTCGGRPLSSEEILGGDIRS